MAMKTCPFCRQQVPVEARDCKFCRRSIMRPCPTCHAEIAVVTVVCPRCNADVPPLVSLGAPAARPCYGPAGEERSIVVWILLGLLTCGIGLYVWIFKIGDDINQHSGTQRVNPGMDILLILLTCGLWIIYVCYRYGQALQEMFEAEGRKPSTGDLPMLGLLLGIFVPIVALCILQNELNQHWKERLSA